MKLSPMLYWVILKGPLPMQVSGFFSQPSPLASTVACCTGMYTSLATSSGKNGAAFLRTTSNV